MKELEYPFDSGYLLKKKRSIKRQLLSDGSVRIKKKNRRSRRLNHERYNKYARIIPAELRHRADLL